MKRRTFLATALVGAAAGVMHGPLRAGAHALAGTTVPAHPAPVTSIAGSASAIDLGIITAKDMAAGVRAAVDAIGGIDRFVREGQTVLLKPNASFPNPPEWGSTTHPLVIRTVAALCLEAGARRIIVADFPMRRAADCFAGCGLAALAADFRGLTVVELKGEEMFEEVDAPKATQFRSVRVAKLARKADVLINLPTAKAHGATTVSFGMKNLMGLIQDRGVFHQEYDLHEAVADLSTVIRPAFTLVDAGWVLLTNGPQGPGRSAQLDTYIAGVDPVAVDAASCALGDWNDRSLQPSKVRHIAAAAARGIGMLDLPPERVRKATLG